MGSQRGKIPSRKPCPLSPPSVGKEEEEEEEERPFFSHSSNPYFLFLRFLDLPFLSTFPPFPSGYVYSPPTFDAAFALALGRREGGWWRG